MTDDEDKIVRFRKPVKKIEPPKGVKCTDVYCIGFQGTDDKSWYVDDPEEIERIFECLVEHGIELHRG